MGNDIHEKPFNEGTLIKLSLLEDYIQEWLPVFLAKRPPLYHRVNIFDFFAGPGVDKIGVDGSPMVTVKSVLLYEEYLESNNVRLRLYFNELNGKKYTNLKEVLQPYITTIPSTEIVVTQKDFKEAFAENYDFMADGDSANFIFIDQNGIKQVAGSTFQEIIQLKTTDFLFFISSSYAVRFCKTPEFQIYLKLDPEEIDKLSYYEIHRYIYNYYKEQIPDDIQMFLAPFSIKKDSNIYGLIFGSHHDLGVKKFLEQCWKNDPQRGEANFDIDQEKIDMDTPYLFEEMNKTLKEKLFEKELKTAVLSKQVRTNKELYIYTLEHGFLPKHSRKIINRWMKDGIIPKQTLHISSGAYNKSESQQIRIQENE